ncbi:hypothetical protein B0H65DRAFT_445215 [Neurospora tetraspora]|uniref:Uncharacterized protein n=1 Tax=Neurospora tetraspora TaxID=94610 RepID=A0AAE0MNA1_9PEZI|nr:hypothetical protein B0H65DRAFT_445215 [Neurospora tetraspora]
MYLSIRDTLGRIGGSDEVWEVRSKVKGYKKGFLLRRVTRETITLVKSIELLREERKLFFVTPEVREVLLEVRALGRPFTGFAHSLGRSITGTPFQPGEPGELEPDRGPLGKLGGR